jgi:hypothetical protein
VIIRNVTSFKRARQFEEEARIKLACVRDRHLYIDTVVILFRAPLPQQAKAVLLEIPRKKSIRRRSKSRQFPYALVLHQPTPQTISALQRTVGEYVLSRIDLALDLETEKPEDAPGVQRYVVRHLTQRYRGKRHTNTVEDTDYWAAKWQRRNIAIYSDRPSKITGQPVCHIEIRLYGADVCRRYGASQLDDLNHRLFTEIIRRNCRLSLLNWPRVEAIIEEMVGTAVQVHNRDHPNDRKTRREIGDRLWSILCHATQEEDWLPTPDELKYASVQASRPY